MALPPSSLICSITKVNDTGSETYCSLSTNRTTAVVITLIALTLISTGLYLFLGGVGTIPAQAGGSGLLLGGVLLISGLIFSYFRKN